MRLEHHLVGGYVRYISPHIIIIIIIRLYTVTERYRLTYAAAMVISIYHVGYYGSHRLNLKLAFQFHALLIMMMILSL